MGQWTTGPVDHCFNGPMEQWTSAELTNAAVAECGDYPKRPVM
jgi:hypothetical protein